MQAVVIRILLPIRKLCLYGVALLTAVTGNALISLSFDAQLIIVPIFAPVC